MDKLLELSQSTREEFESIPTIEKVAHPLSEKHGSPSGSIDAEWETYGEPYRDEDTCYQRGVLTKDSAIKLACVLEKQLSEPVITGNWLKKCQESTTDVANLQKTIEVYRAAIVALAKEL